MIRPSVNEILKPLKPFQRRTVEHGFHRLFLDEDGTSRFLVADEVGLGKTLVARGIIARAIDHLWDHVKRIDVVYICSNASIARANLPKLQIGGANERSFALATRVTMLATELSPQEDSAGLSDSKLNFISFTPHTSFDTGRSSGQRREREVLFHLLVLHTSRRTALMNLLQGEVKDKTGWREGLEYVLPIEEGIRDRFNEAFNYRDDMRSKMEELFDKWFHRYREYWPEQARWSRNELIGELRQLLAGVCIKALEPDLVILDEFQRFRTLIETREGRQNSAAELAQSLFNTEAHDGRPVRTLLLSATPYKLYTTDAEIGHEDHYEDFLATTRFLFNADESRVETLMQQLTRFGAALKRVTEDDSATIETLTSAKIEIENILKDVMARTERVTASEDRNGMVEEHKPDVFLSEADIRQYLATDALFRAVGDRDPMPFWKSAPYLVHFMRGYKFNERLEQALDQSPDTVAEVLRRHHKAFLCAKKLLTWSTLDPAHAELRNLISNQLDTGYWRLLWVPPTLPYWPLEGPFEGKASASKTLLFSAWNFVPDVVSAVLSYEAERRMTKGRIKDYQDPAKQQVPLLRFAQSAAGIRSRHRLLLLLMPCLQLADKAHPLDAPLGRDRRKWVRDKIEELLADPSLPNPQEGEVDDRWEWAAPIILDSGLRTFLQAWRNDDVHEFFGSEPLHKPNPDLFDKYLKDLLDLPIDGLGRRPSGLTDLLTEVALGSPVILALRTLAVKGGIEDYARRRFSVMIADAFWSLFNQPAVISLLRQLATNTGTSGDERVYWRQVLEYCRQGNLQAVLDEQWHMLWEQHSWSEDMDANNIAAECTKVLVQVVHPVRSRVHTRFLQAKNGDSDDPEKIRIRTVFALRFGHTNAEDGEQAISQDTVRAAFNSPFRPFVLTTTSIGQEGLDFHPWCHRIVHWNLPGNPVDLEQREGRIHRYKGHAVRRNIAVAHGDAVFECWRHGEDLWELIFQHAEQAARYVGESDLVPYWIAPGDYRVQRHVPLLPYATEVEAFQRLKRQLAAYRVVFGQPRQQELITLLEQSSMSDSQLDALTINLSPRTL